MRKILGYTLCLLLIGFAAYAGMSTLFFRGTGGGCAGTLTGNIGDTDESGATGANEAAAYRIRLRKVTVADGGELASITMYTAGLDDSSHTARACIYDDDGGSGEPGTLLYGGAEMYDAGWTAADWYPMASGLSECLPAPTVSAYWIGHFWRWDSGQTYYYDDDVGENHRFVTSTSEVYAAGCPATAPAMSTSTRMVQVYATFN